MGVTYCAAENLMPGHAQVHVSMSTPVQVLFRCSQKAHTCGIFKTFAFNWIPQMPGKISVIDILIVQWYVSSVSRIGLDLSTWVILDQNERKSFSVANTSTGTACRARATPALKPLR